MNYIKHLTGFFEKVANDRLLNPTHISLYISLFQFWNYNRFKNPISISRDEVMRISKISSKATYHKCLKELHSRGYIKYEPSYNPFKGSHVFLFNFSDDLKPLSKSGKAASPNFEPVVEQALNNSQTSTGTSPELVDEQAVVPSINNTNNSNITNVERGLNGQAPENEIEDSGSGFKNQDSEKKEEESSAKEEEMPERSHDEKEKTLSPAFADYSAFEIKRRTVTGSQVNFIPAIAEVLAYFSEQDFPEIEANKFFNYFQSIGWLVGGKAPMADWPAAARNWMLNAPKYATHDRTDRTKHLDTSSGKDYSEPL